MKILSAVATITPPNGPSKTRERSGKRRGNNPARTLQE
jgi:hypothetical protein